MSNPHPTSQQLAKWRRQFYQQNKMVPHSGGAFGISRFARKLKAKTAQP